MTSKIFVFIYDPKEKLSSSIELNDIVEKLKKVKDIIRVEVLKDIERFIDFIDENILKEGICRFIWIGNFSDLQREYIVNELVLRGINPYLHEWCNLEEQGIGDDSIEKDIQTKRARILIRMALYRARSLEPLESLKKNAIDSILIVGAGISGLHAAVSLGAIGKKVYLVEKESGVGGKVAQLSRLFPRMCDPFCGIEYELSRLKEIDKINVYTLSKVKEVSGGPGSYKVILKKNPRYVDERRCNACGECIKVCPVFLNEIDKAIHPSKPFPFPNCFIIEREYCPEQCYECLTVCPTNAINLKEEVSEMILEVGSILLTTGWDLYNISSVEEFGYNVYPNVISNLDMENFLRLDDQILKKTKSIGFIQCAGSRDKRHLNYCSSVCCGVTIKQIIYLKEKNPEANCYVFYQDIRTPGFSEDLYEYVKNLDNVIFIRGFPSTIKPEKNSDKLNIKVEDTLSGKEINLSLDLLVLAGGMTPSEGGKEIAETLGMPTNNYGFFESHIQCYPEETQRTGIYVGGCCREPMSISQSIESAHLAAMKALSFINTPIVINPTYPVIDKTKCDVCKRCMQECPFAAYYFDEHEFPSVDLLKCRQCGICMGACPVQAISVQHFTIQQLVDQIKAIDPLYLGKNEPVILALLCKNDAFLAAKWAIKSGFNLPNVFYIKVPCAGSVNNAVIAEALASGIDGVLVGGCVENQCHYIRGSQLAKTRANDLIDKLKKMMIEPERVQFVNLEIRDMRKFIEVLNQFVDELKKIGPNPFKNK